MQFLPTLINFFTPIITNFVITPVLPLMLPPEPEPVKQEVPEVPINYTNSYDVLSSWYGPGFHGGLAASGEIFNQYDLTAAHPSLPFDTRLHVLYEGNSVVVRVNDRGPYEGNRGLDLSMAAAQQIGLIDAGVDYVTITQLSK